MLRSGQLLGAGKMTAYRFQKLSKELVYIRWEKTPNEKERDAFLKDIQRTLDESEGKLYFISDLRKGRISDLQSLRQLVQILLRSDKYAGGCSFSSDAKTKTLAGVFAKIADTQNVRDKDCETAEEALAFLETLCPELTKDIDWKNVFQ
ncbi:MAG: hypothetical protein K8I82_19445 [Anaerolineae bacterium]|jgi:hypothetical protein|nr:hypothetical protein [Anaerolineae bacterium]